MSHLRYKVSDTNNNVCRVNNDGIVIGSGVMPSCKFEVYDNVPPKFSLNDNSVKSTIVSKTLFMYLIDS